MTALEPDEIVLVTLGLSFGLGGAVILLAGLGARTKRQGAELWAFYRSEFLIVACLLIAAWLARGTFALALAVFAGRAGFELFRVFGRPYAGSAPWRRFVAAEALVLLACAMADALRGGAGGFLWIFFVFATVEIGDAFALMCGKLFGRWRILPRLSPRKTGAGLLGGFLCGGAAGYWLGLTLLNLAPLPAAALAGTVLVAGLSGDLLASALKRAHGAKDFPPVLARHGGALDIYDSFLAAAPAAFAFRLIAGV